MIEIEVDAVEEEIKKKNKGKRGLPRDQAAAVLYEAAKRVRFISLI